MQTGYFTFNLQCRLQYSKQLFIAELLLPYFISFFFSLVSHISSTPPPPHTHKITPIILHVVLGEKLFSLDNATITATNMEIWGEIYMYTTIHTT